MSMTTPSQDLHTAAELVRRMRGAARAFLESLAPEQRSSATAPFSTPDHRDWTYLPGSRPGLALADMTDRQRELAMELLDTGLSEHGAARARGIMALEQILSDLERETGRDGWERRHPHFFWFRVLGDPAGDEPWGWRANGHHLAVHLTIAGDTAAVTPQFFGANPARVPTGPQAGHRTLPDEEDLGFALVGALDADRRSVAVADPIAPNDILTRRDPAADPGRIRAGLAYADMADEQRELLVRLVRLYLGRATPALADRSWQEIVDAGLEPVSFTWAGDTSPAPGRACYYAVTGPSFLLEYDNSQNGANHAHTVWRDLRHDWGEDLLARHYAAAHRR